VTPAVRRDYDQRAEAYDRRWRWYREATLRETLARAEIRTGDRILDVGCGTGRLLEALAKDHSRERLAGIDLSGGMLGVARRRLPSEVRLVQGDAAALPFPDGGFDLVLTMSAFHFWPRPRAALGEIHRVLGSGGRLVLTDWSRDFWGPRLREAWLRLLDPSHHRTWRLDEVEELLGAVGFRVVARDLYRIRPTWGMMTVGADRPG
jgi:ubiquinone/menaquinone biosynthesis C-methylase UbiE